MNATERARGRPEHRTGADPWVQAFGFLGGAISWLLHLAIAYGLTEIDCRSQRLAFEFLGLPGLHVLGLILTLLAALTAAAATFAAATSHPRRLGWSRLDPRETHESEGRSRFMAFTGTGLSALFTLAILSGGSAFILLRGCA